MADFAEASMFGLRRKEKRAALLQALNTLTAHHIASCPEYRAIMSARGVNDGDARTLEEIPFIPVRLFKSNLLSSVAPEQVVKTLTSSGTTGEQVSRIVLDAATAKAQARTLVRIMQSVLGKARLPMIIVDHEGVIKDRNFFSARGAGVRGMMQFGRDCFFALRDEGMTLNREGLEAFLGCHREVPVLVFGFTFMVWEYFVQPLVSSGRPVTFDGVLVHSGGWKKLADRAVSNEVFKQGVKAAASLTRVHNFYGMVEQVGSVFLECSSGHLHAPSHADVLIRSATDWAVLGPGQRGVVQVLSALPESYPGHSLLTEDEGELIGEDDCPCGQLGKAFRIHGRLAMAETRGCSDTHEKRAG